MDKLTEAADLALQAGTLVQAQADALAEKGTAVSDDAGALAGDLDASAKGIGTYGSETRTRLSTMAADPVAVEATRANAVGGAQDGLAPFLMALAAWLGVLGAFLVLPAIWASDRRRWVRGVLVAFGLAALVGVGGSLLMVVGMRVLLGLQVANLVGLIGFALLSTLAFTAIVQALVAMFGSRGWLLGLLLLVVQVAAVGIPYAASLAPGPIAAIAPLMPMTYAVDALRGAIAGAGSHPALDALALAAFLVVAMLITLAAAAGPALRREVGPEVGAEA
jgi:putative membrane protein